MKAGPEGPVRAPSAVPIDDAVLPYEVDALDEHKVAAALDQLRAAIAEMADRLPLHGDFVAQCCGRANPAATRTEFAV